ncbi:hypothetical protein ACFSTE_15320 [Aquimarina hainanensis]|uniref:Outer membrane protein beta-barrel domain-containing protein n=1 Tax=Aquimarina hainanensis TaxID=1578017 RepID=A0ABW5N9B4_9FLAO|nr:hypothetical protein [Aquimarina sp. TRL1]QKX03472.1 hypothetical protein HN014_00575 [Aquimarina sp. TRL1]
METGSSVATFEFKNSMGTSLDNLLPKTNTYIAIGYKHSFMTNAIRSYKKSSFFDKGVNIVFGVSYTPYGASGSDTNNSFEWDVNYLGANLGVEYGVFSVNDFTFYIKAATSFEYLLNGTQRINNQVFNVFREEEFKSLAVFIRTGVGINYPISNKSNLFAQYTYGKSFALKDRGSSSDEQLHIKNHMIGIGITINILKY